ncbi:MAG: NfeD family protein [Acidimicrobiia bacterium]
MNVLINEPAITYLFVLAAVIGLLIEIAPGPTFGIPAALALGCTGLAAWGITHQGLAWWPLPFVAVGVVLWGVLLWTGPRPGLIVTATVAFAFGSLGFTIATMNVPAIAIAALASVGAPLGFAKLRAATGSLRTMPPQTGLDSLVGRRALVTQWSHGAGRVELDGAYWTASGPDELDRGADVTITGYEGLHVQVERSN